MKLSNGPSPVGIRALELSCNSASSVAPRAGGGQPRIESINGAIAVVDGADAAGQVSATFAARTAVSLAQKYGMAGAWVQRGNHFGAAGYYGEQIARQGFFALVMCSTDAVMCPPGGTRPIVGTNPLCIAAPPDESNQVLPMLDMATSAVAWGKLLLAAQNNETIPEGWALDQNGLPTTDPQAGLKGSLCPVGGPKGFGLSFMIDVLSGVATGAATGPRIGAISGDSAIPQRLSQVFLVIKLDPLDLDGGYIDGGLSAG